MKWIEVQSSNLNAIAWDSQTLFVRFHHGGEYAYDGVPYETFVGLTQAESVGKFLNTEVKGRYPYRHLADAEAEAEA